MIDQVLLVKMYVLLMVVDFGLKKTWLVLWRYLKECFTKLTPPKSFKKIISELEISNVKHIFFNLMLFCSFWVTSKIMCMYVSLATGVLAYVFFNVETHFCFLPTRIMDYW